MVSRYEDLVRVGEFDKPVEEVKHLLFSPIVSEVTAMHDDIRRQKPFQFSVTAMCVRDLEYSHICIIREDVVLRIWCGLGLWTLYLYCLFDILYQDCSVSSIQS